MHSFKKTLKTVTLFLLAFLLISVLLIESYYCVKPYYYQDSEVRSNLAGTLDFIICGASHAIRALDPRILDTELGVSSYNLSGSLMTIQGRYELLKKELSRNHVKTVILELSWDAMVRTKHSGFEGNYYVLARLDSISERVSFFFHSILPVDYGQVYYHAINDGIGALKRLAKITAVNKEERFDRKGYYPWTDGPTDLALSEEEQIRTYNTRLINTNIEEYSLNYLNSIIDLCKGNDVDVIIIATPISNRMICQTANLDFFREYYQQLADENGFVFIDFSLLKDRDAVLDDHTSYWNDSHLTDDGAESFSYKFSSIMKMLFNGEDISELFYPSYAAMKADKSYSQ